MIAWEMPHILGFCPLIADAGNSVGHTTEAYKGASRSIDPLYIFFLAACRSR